MQVILLDDVVVPEVVAKEMVKSPYNNYALTVEPVYVHTSSPLIGQLQDFFRVHW